jgi:hypothetical protein
MPNQVRHDREGTVTLSRSHARPSEHTLHSAAGAAEREQGEQDCEECLNQDLLD